MVSKGNDPHEIENNAERAVGLVNFMLNCMLSPLSSGVIVLYISDFHTTKSNVRQQIAERPLVLLPYIRESKIRGKRKTV